MRFCNQCGRQLQEGEVCTCQQKALQNRQQNGQNARLQNGVPLNNQNVSGTGSTTPGAGHRPAPGMGYQAGNNSPQHQQPVGNHPQLQQPNGSYPQPNGYNQQPNNSYQQPNGNYQQPNGYNQQLNTSYQQPNGNYQQQQPYGNYQPYQQPYGQNTNRFIYEAKNLFTRIIPLLKDPVGETTQVARSRSSVPGIVMVISNLVATLLMLIIAMIYIDTKLGSAASWVHIPYASIIIAILVLAAVTYFSMAGLILLASRTFFKAPTDFSEIISIVGVKALLDGMVIIISILFMMMLPILGVILFVAGNLYTTLVCFFSYAETVELAGSKKVYSLLITYATQFMLFYLMYSVMFANFLATLTSYFF